MSMVIYFSILLTKPTKPSEIWEFSMELNFALTADTLWLFACEYNDELHNNWEVLVIYEEYVIYYILETKIVWFVSMSSVI